MAMIHIADNKSDAILDYIPEHEYWNDERTRELTSNRDTFDFETFATESYAGVIEERNRIIIPERGGETYAEFIIEEARQVLDGDLHYKVAYCTASYLELRKQKQIPPQVVNGYTPRQHVEFALSGTEWQVGNVDYGEVHTTTLTAYMDAFAYLQNTARWAGMELVFRVEHNGYKVTGRYVDLLKRDGVWRGHEAVFGKDLMGIERARKFDEVVTALIGIGPENDDGSPREEVYIESDTALARWGRNGMHLVEVYEPESQDQNINPEKLHALTQEELNRRISHQSEYVAKIHTLAEVMGVDPADLRFGDIIRIKDEEFNPPIYLEARIHTMKESVKEYSESEVTLGDFTEFTRDEVKAALERFRTQLAKMVTEAELVTATNQAQANAENYAAEQAYYARANAEAYADGLITTEEQARLEDAQAKLDEAKAYAEKQAADAVAAIDNSGLATKEELAQEAQEIRDQLTTRGGANLLRNSIGYAGMDFWAFSTANTNVSTVMSTALSTLGFGCGFFFAPDGTGKGIQQTITVEPGKAYTLSWYLSKAAAGDFTTDIIENGTVIATHIDSSAVGGGFVQYSKTFTPSTDSIIVRFTAAGTTEATLTGNMLGIGDLPVQWTLATGELYNAYVRADERGLIVLRLDDNGNVEGYTNMSPEEFAGYYDENRDGNFERVFWLNQDETVTKKLRALDEITMGTIKVVRIQSTGNRGWAFVPIVAET